MSVILNKPEIIFWDQPACLLLELQIILLNKYTYLQSVLHVVRNWLAN